MCKQTKKVAVKTWGGGESPGESGHDAHWASVPPSWGSSPRRLTEVGVQTEQDGPGGDRPTLPGPELRHVSKTEKSDLGFRG